jgi:serine/threonine protein kinase
MKGLAACAEAGSSSEGRFKAMPSSEDDEQVSLDEFRVLRELGEGTSGVVCLVRHKPTGRLYAKKVINLGCSDKERTQILMEIRTLHKSHVPGIIAFKNAFYADNAVHIVLEYMNCGSLASVVQRSGPLPEQLLARVTSDVLGGVDQLHRVLKVVHRDIKPANVLLNDNAEVKLADFGMSGQLANTFGRLASWVRGLPLIATDCH